MDGRVSVDLHAVVGSGKGLRDGSMIIVSDELASNGAFVLHDLIKRHLKSGGLSAGTSQTVISQTVSSDCSGRLNGIPHQKSTRSNPISSNLQRQEDGDRCATAVCLVALTRTPSEHCSIAKRQVTLIQHLSDKKVPEEVLICNQSTVHDNLDL